MGLTGTTGSKDQSGGQTSYTNQTSQGIFSGITPNVQTIGMFGSSGESKIKEYLDAGLEAIKTKKAEMLNLDIKLIPVYKQGVLAYAGLAGYLLSPKTNTVTYTVLLIGDTGTPVHTAGGVQNEFTQYVNSANSSFSVDRKPYMPNIWVPSDANNDVAHAMIQNSIAQHCGISVDKLTFVYINGNVVSSLDTLQSKEQKGEVIVGLLASMLVVDSVLAANPGDDFVITNDITSAYTLQANFSNSHGRVITDPITGRVYPAAIISELVFRAKNNNSNKIIQDGPNSTDNEIIHSKTAGYIDFIVNKSVMQTGFVGGSIELNRIHPVAVLEYTEQINRLSTPQNTFLSVASWFLAANRPIALSACLPSDKSFGDIGVLNKYVRQPDGSMGTPISLSDPSISLGDKFEIASKIILGETILAIDYRLGDPFSTGLRPFVLASPLETDPNIREGAQLDIITAFHRLTRGEFPMSYPMSEIITDAFILPTGEYEGKVGKRPIEDIDLPTLTGAEVGDKAVYEYDAVNKNIQGVNTFIQRILSVGLLATNAQITGKKVRIVLNSKFVYAVAAAFERLQNGGIVYTTDMNVVFNAVNGGFAQWANSQNSMLVNQLGMNRHAGYGGWNNSPIPMGFA